MRTLATVAVLACWVLGAQIAAAHAVFMSYIEHRAQATIGRDNIDIRIDLTFFEIRSMAERRRMDADGDGRIAADETRAYLAKIAPSIAGAVQLQVDGRPVDLVPLYEPEIDVLGVNEVAPSHLLLRLFYFARTPAWLRAGSETVFEDRLWPQAAAIRAFEVSGRDGCQVTTKNQSDPVSAPAVAAGPQRFAARCAAAPIRVGEEANRAAAGDNPTASRAAPWPIPRTNNATTRLYPASLTGLAVMGGTFLFCFARRNRQESRNHARTDPIGSDLGT